MASTDMAGGLQMLDLPQGAEGLAWISRKGPAQLLLIPGVQPASIAAAALGDQQALVCLRVTAQQHAAGVQPFDDFTAFQLAASRADPQTAVHTQQLKVAYKERLESTEHLLVQAAKEGQLAAFRWLQALCHPIEPLYEAALMRAAASGGQLHILQFLRSRPTPAFWDTLVSCEAVDHLDCLKWLLTQDPPCPFDECIIETAVCSGALDVLRWLRTLPQIPLNWWSDETWTHSAAYEGNLDMLKWLRSLDPPCPWAANACTAAASWSNFEMLRWMRAQQPPCPWDEMCAEAAAGQGDIRMLEWISAQDPPCPWGPNSTLLAATGGHLEALKFLHSHGCSVTSDAYWAAASSRQVLRWLHGQKIPAPSRLPVAWRGIPTPILMFLGDIGVQLPDWHREKLQTARRSFCAFLGLLRWCRSAVSDPSRGAHRAFDYLCQESSGQELLVLLSRLPPELVSKIAVAANLQHDFFQS